MTHESTTTTRCAMALALVALAASGVAILRSVETSPPPPPACKVPPPAFYHIYGDENKTTHRNNFYLTTETGYTSNSIRYMSKTFDIVDGVDDTALVGFESKTFLPAAIEERYIIETIRINRPDGAIEGTMFRAHKNPSSTITIEPSTEYYILAATKAFACVDRIRVEIHNDQPGLARRVHFESSRSA